MTTRDIETTRGQGPSTGDQPSLLIFIPGGCFFISAVGELGAQPGPVRDGALRVSERWLMLLAEQVAAAQEAGELDPDADPAQVAFELNALIVLGNMQCTPAGIERMIRDAPVGRPRRRSRRLKHRGRRRTSWRRPSRPTTRPPRDRHSVRGLTREHGADNRLIPPGLRAVGVAREEVLLGAVEVCLVGWVDVHVDPVG